MVPLKDYNRNLRDEFYLDIIFQVTEEIEEYTKKMTDNKILKVK